MAEQDWKKTDKRFVVFFDIMGFKELVQRNTHDKIVEKLTNLKNNLKELEIMQDWEILTEFSVEQYQTKSITFSDSIIIFSKSEQINDIVKILLDAYIILLIAIDDGIAIKGAFSYGEITVDFENSIFFGQPIIDAYLLHDELQIYTVIADHNFEMKLSSFPKTSILDQFLTGYKANLKSGKVTHKVLRPIDNDEVKSHIDRIMKLYYNVSGRPRSYVDNTIDFLRSLLPDEPTSSHPAP